jgi:hypothetical protein
VAARAAVLGNGTIGGEKALGVPWRHEPLQTPRALTGGLMGVLGAVVQVTLLSLCYTRQDLALRPATDRSVRRGW